MQFCFWRQIFPSIELAESFAVDGGQADLVL